MRIHVLVYTHISSLLCQLKRPRNTKTPVATNVTHSQFLDSINILQLKNKTKLELFREMSDLRTGAENERERERERERKRDRGREICILLIPLYIIQINIL